LLFKSNKSKETTFEAKCDILAELWLNHRDDEDFIEFCEYNDLGLPLSYLLANDVVGSTEAAIKFVDETFGLLLEKLSLEDRGFTSLDDLIGLEAEEEPEAVPTGSVPKFCASCGTRYEGDSQKFCASCGAARI
jgi:hypothetical protein